MSLMEVHPLQMVVYHQIQYQPSDGYLPVLLVVSNYFMKSTTRYPYWGLSEHLEAETKNLIWMNSKLKT